MHMQLHTTVFRVANLERSRRWYEEKLGMTVVYEDIHFKLISLEKGGNGRISLWEMRPGEAPTATAKEMAYIVFLTQDALEDYRILVERGANVSPIEEYQQGLRMFWITDPDNHRHCVIEFLPE
jgi:catechol 2,3-dioxygenase-like lactoylglutathione lyase family enzyme